MKLKKIVASACGGISPNAAIVIDFEGNNAKMATAKADNARNKTSLLRAAMVGTAALSPDKDLVNKLSNTLDIDVHFKGNDRLDYVARTTKSAFTLRYEGDTTDIPSPKAKVKEVFGVTGVSPMGIKEANIEGVIKWLSTYTTKGAEEFDAQVKKFKEGAKAAKEARATAGKTMKGLQEFLGTEDMYLDWEKSEKKYAKKVSVAALSAKLEDAGKKSDLYLKAEEKLKNHKNNAAAQERRIEDLRTQLAAAENELALTNSAIKTAEKYLADNKSVKTEYDAVRKEYDNAAQEAVNYEKWQEIKRKKAELDEYETMWQKADAKEKDFLAKLQEVRAELIPDIKGVELLLDDEMENGKVTKKAGMYWNGKNINQLSESEFWSVVLQIWRKNKVRFVVIDNFQDLGSMAVEILQKLIKDGCYVLCAEMARNQDELIIEYA